MKKENVKILFVNPVERISVQGRHKQVYTINSSMGVVPTVSMKKTKELGTTFSLQFLPNPQTGKLQTGLNVMISNYILKDRDPQEVIDQYNLSELWRDIIPKIVKQDNIKKQTWFEIKHGVDPNYYTDEYTYSMTRMPTDLKKWGEKTFLQGFKYILYPRPNRITNESPRQELAIEAIKNCPLVAENKNIVNSAYHEWYISEENEAEVEKARRRESIEDAVYELVKLRREGGKFKTYQTAILLRDFQSKPILKGKVNQEGVENVLSNYINNKNSHQMTYIDNFNKIIDMTKSSEGMIRFKIQYLIQQALNTHVIAKRDNKYLWHSKAGTPNVYDLGSNFDRMVSFFIKEYNIFNEDDLETTNWYKDLLEEVKGKQIWFE